MKSIRSLYKIGRGPSSSHSMGPGFACAKMLTLYPDADSFKVTLYGSLAMTGKGHMTDKVITESFAPKEATITFDTSTPCENYQNTMDIIACRGELEIGRERVYSIGGGDLIFEGREGEVAPEIYPHKKYTDIANYCREHNIRLWEYVEKFEGEGIRDYLSDVWSAMKESINSGLSAVGTLDGGLMTRRKANYLYNQRHIDESAQTRENRLVCAYAFAVSEQNAAAGKIVTAPTCGSSGVLPSVLRYMQETRGFSDTEILHALATGGIIGNLIRTNASISGAECGCQAEIGSACSMAAAALGELFDMGTDQIEYAAEVAMEHHLGLTCDPINGLVQIPCIERNAVAAMRAINALSLANFLTDTRKISFDTVVETMYATGRDLLGKYRETAKGGLAEHYKN